MFIHYYKRTSGVHWPIESALKEMLHAGPDPNSSLKENSSINFPSSVKVSLILHILSSQLPSRNIRWVNCWVEVRLVVYMKPHSGANILIPILPTINMPLK